MKFFSVLQLFIVSLFLKLSLSFQHCPNQCHCWGQEVYCSSRQLTEFPRTFPSKVVQLSMENNSITTLNSLSNLNLSLLHILILQNNKIAYLMPQTFIGVSGLRFLDLSNNNLRNISRSCFESLKQLKLLNLSCNKITRIEAKSLSDLLSLTELFLSENRISSLHLGLFASLVKLKHLRLDHNSIQSLSGGIFLTLSALTHFDLSYNRLQVLTSKATRGLAKLQEINLQNNRIRILDPFYSKSRRQCSELLRDLPKYSVQSPLPQIFQNSKNIRRINLANNTLRAIDYRSFSHLKKLNEVLLSENPWRCDCFLKWNLARLRSEHGDELFRFGAIYCHEPKELSGLSINDITLEDLMPDEPFQRNNHWKINPDLQKTGKPFTTSISKNTFSESEPLVVSTINSIFTDDVTHSMPTRTMIADGFPAFATTAATKNVNITTKQTELRSQTQGNVERFSTHKILVGTNLRPNDEKIKDHRTLATEKPKTNNQKDVTLITLLLGALAISIIFSIVCCILLIRNKSYNFRCCFDKQESFQQHPNELLRSYPSYPLVYDNPLARRPLPSYPAQSPSKIAIQYRRPKLVKNDMNMRWTCGGTFGLGESKNSKTFTAIKSHDNTCEDSEKFFPVSATQHLCCDSRNHHVEKIHNLKTLMLNQKDKTGVIRKSNSERAASSYTDQSDYLIPLVIQSESCHDQMLRSSETGLNNFDLIPTISSHSSLENSSTVKLAKKEYRERIMKKMFKVLKELETLNEESNRQLEEDIHESLYVMTENFLQNQISKLTSLKRALSSGEKCALENQSLYYNRKLENSQNSSPEKSNINKIQHNYNVDNSIPVSLNNDTKHSNQSGSYDCKCFKSAKLPIENFSKNVKFSSNCTVFLPPTTAISTWNETKKTTTTTDCHLPEKYLDPTSDSNAFALNSTKQSSSLLTSITDVSSTKYSVFSLGSSGNKDFELPLPSRDALKDEENKKKEFVEKSEKNWKRKDSIDSMFVFANNSNDELSSNSDEECSAHAMANDNSLVSKRLSYSKPHVSNNRLKIRKEQYRKSMPLYKELLEKSKHISDEQDMEFLQKSKMLVGSDFYLNSRKKDFGNFSFKPCLVKKGTKNSYKDHQKRFGKSKTPTNNMDIYCLKSEKLTELNDYFIHKSQFTPSKIFDADFKLKNNLNDLNYNNLEDKLSDSFSSQLQGRKFSISSFGTASVSSIEFENKMPLKNKEIEKKGSDNDRSMLSTTNVYEKTCAKTLCVVEKDASFKNSKLSHTGKTNEDYFAVMESSEEDL